MEIDLNPEALEYGDVASRAFESAGGDRLVEEAEAEPQRRATLVDPVLAELGAWDLDVRADGDELEAGAALCRAAGYWAVPTPVAERLARPVDLDADGLVIVADVRPVGAVASTDLRWIAMDLDGRRSAAAVRPSTVPARRTAFVADLDLTAIDDGPVIDVALGLVLPCWTLLGMLDRALDLTRRYVNEREQFGQRLSSFQGVQFQLTDAEVERTGLEQLARHALWSVQAGRPEALDDALALRLAAIEAADVVFRVSHQLHGTIGFCDETTLSWLSRYSQPLRRHPLGVAGTQDALVRRLGSSGLTGIFSPIGGIEVMGATGAAGAAGGGAELPECLTIEADGPIRTVTINRPDALNAVDEELHWALANVWRMLAADTEARCVILTGAGRAFSAGGDLDWITSFLDDPVARAESLREGAQIIDEVLRFPLPVIAAVNGPAVGLGCSVAMLCDVVLMSERAYLADPHVSVGLVAGDGGAAFWPLLAPLLRVREYLYTGDRIPAAQAVELGLASRTTTADELMAEARRLADRFAAQPPEALQATKRILTMHLASALSGPVQAGFAAEAHTMETEEHRQRLLRLRRAQP